MGGTAVSWAPTMSSASLGTTVCIASQDSTMDVLSTLLYRWGLKGFKGSITCPGLVKI